MGGEGQRREEEEEKSNINQLEQTRLTKMGNFLDRDRRTNRLKEREGRRNEYTLISPVFEIVQHIPSPLTLPNVALENINEMYKTSISMINMSGETG